MYEYLLLFEISCLFFSFHAFLSVFQAFLANEDLGDSLDGVEALIKKHEDFEKSLAAQEEKIKALNDFATKLIEDQHYAADDVAARRDAVSFTFKFTKICQSRMGIFKL